jgi:hypothetical protein
MKPCGQIGVGMSERALAFVEEWVNEYEPEGDTSAASALAQKCLSEAKADGITEAEIKEAIDDLTQFMAGQIVLVNDNEADRIAAKDDLKAFLASS